MPNRTNASENRAEARRRARQIARGETDDAWNQQSEAQPEEQRKPGLLERIIPPAPPLRGKPDPLAGFAYSGRWPRIATGLYLLRRNPLAWVVPGLVWGGLAIAIPVLSQNSLGFLAVNITQYVALIAAGWVGWQRPWLYGVMAALLGLALWTVYVGIFPDQFVTAGSARPNVAALGVYFAYQAPVQLLLGFVAGWYGGYLRRRLASPPPEQRRRR